MIKFNKLISVLLCVCTLLCAFTACNPKDDQTDDPAEHIDYAAELKLDMSTTTAKQEVTVKTYIDGDTTHFYFPGFDEGVFKARYLAINTPESTGRIEEWGKKASSFTREKLESAASIIIESDDDKWNADSTGSRYLAWIWYKTDDMTDYRNLNVEILQSGLAIASNSANNRYGTTCMAAINQAKSEKLYVYSKDKDPDFPYGQATELTLKELRCNIENYDNGKVAFEGVIIKADSGSVFIEEYDAEDNMYYGMTVYYQTAGLPGDALNILSVGNRVRIVGTVTQFQGMWQVSGLSYSLMKPDSPENIKFISDGHSPSYTPTTPDTFANGKVTVTVGDETKTYDYANLALYTSVEMRELTVKSTYTTDSGDNKGAITLTCEADGGIEISVRTIVLHDADGNLVTADYFKDATIDIKGIVDIYTYDGSNQYQIKVFSINDITIHP